MTANIVDANFNPRPREGSDRVTIELSKKGFIISIHAPVKGATYRARKAVQGSNFNPRPREGSDSAKLHRLRLKLINTKELIFPKIQFCH